MIKRKKCGCVWRSFSNNEDGPAEAFWDLCDNHQDLQDKKEQVALTEIPENK